MHDRFPRPIATAAALVALTACGGGGSSTTPPPTVASITKVAGDNQVGAAGATLPTSLQVVVKSGTGDPVADAVVTWAAASGGGSVTASKDTTGADGIATTGRVLGGAAGTQTTSATVGAVSATFTHVAQIQGATQIAASGAVTRADTVKATVAPLSVVVKDQSNAPVAGVIVLWSTTGGSMSAVADTTDAGGLASATWSLGSTAGTQTAQGSVSGLIGSPVTFTATASAGNATQIAKTSGDGGTAAPNAGVTYTVTTRDAYGNPKGGVTVDWAVASGGGTIAPPQNTTASNGQASATHTLGGTTGSQTATATASSIAGAPAVTFSTTAAIVVTVGNGNNFNPSSVSLKQNGSVTWTWASGSAIHNITWSTAGAPANEPDRSSGSVSRTFANTGTFNYSCTNHPGMNGSVTVTP